LRIKLFWWLILLILFFLWSVPKVARFLYPLPYRDLILECSTREGIDPLLVAAVIRVESRFYPRARSSHGACGLMQLMPETAQMAARKLGLPYEPEKLYDPEYNLRLGTWYLSSLLEEFGELPPALAAYNGGKGHVRNWLDRGLWDGKTLEKIPFPETREFTRQVLRDYRIYKILYSREIDERGISP